MPCSSSHRPARPPPARPPPAYRPPPLQPLWQGRFWQRVLLCFSPSRTPTAPPPAVQTLQLYWRRRRFTDFALFLVGFLLAIIYHYLHMHPEGIAGAQLLGLSGPAWRGLDILMAQVCVHRAAC